jgi:hypothetical protein
MSTHVKRVLNRRFLLALSLVLTMLAFSFVLAQPPQAVASEKAGASARTCPPDTAVVTYYTDASMTVACGWHSLTCHCNNAQWGCKTPYHTTEFLLCE